LFTHRLPFTATLLPDWLAVLSPEHSISSDLSTTALWRTGESERVFVVIGWVLLFSDIGLFVTFHLFICDFCLVIY
jgi:hypothetical protein